jgi:hypothetical protein
MRYPFTPRTHALVTRHWNRLHDGSIRSVDAITCRTADDSELTALFERYLAENAERYLDVPRTAAATSRPFLHLVARRADGSAAALMMLHPTSWMVDVLYGTGPSRHNMLGLLAQLRYLHRAVPRRAPELLFAAATDNVAGIMRRLGADEHYVMDVWVPDPPTRGTDD